MTKSSRELSKKIRLTSLNLVAQAKSSHISSALSIADILSVLYAEVMNFRNSDANLFDRDRLVLSKGHACVALYAALHHVGFVKKKELYTYGSDSSNLMSHISHKVNGVEFSSGSLGHGLSFALGKCLFSKIKDLDFRNFVIAGDGELQEGSNWEAIMFAAHYKLNNITLIVDNNNLQSLTTVKKTMNIFPLKKKFISFGWDCININGHDHQQLLKAFSIKQKKPTCIICQTTKGKGVSFMEDSVEWHYKYPNDIELKRAIKEINNA